MAARGKINQLAMDFFFPALIFLMITTNLAANFSLENNANPAFLSLMLPVAMDFAPDQPSFCQYPLGQLPLPYEMETEWGPLKISNMMSIHSNADF